MCFDCKGYQTPLNTVLNTIPNDENTSRLMSSQPFKFSVFYCCKKGLCFICNNWSSAFSSVYQKSDIIWTRFVELIVISSSLKYVFFEIRQRKSKNVSTKLCIWILTVKNIGTYFLSLKKTDIVYIWKSHDQQKDKF